MVTEKGCNVTRKHGSRVKCDVTSPEKTLTCIYRYFMFIYRLWEIKQILTFVLEDMKLLNKKSYWPPFRVCHHSCLLVFSVYLLV